MSYIENKSIYSNNIWTRDTFKYNLNIDNSQADKFKLWWQEMYYIGTDAQHHYRNIVG